MRQYYGVIGQLCVLSFRATEMSRSCSLKTWQRTKILWKMAGMNDSLTCFFMWNIMSGGYYTDKHWHLISGCLASCCHHPSWVQGRFWHCGLLRILQWVPKDLKQSMKVGNIGFHHTILKCFFCVKNVIFCPRCICLVLVKPSAFVPTGWHTDVHSQTFDYRH